jgi:hypothetical protein
MRLGGRIAAGWNHGTRRALTSMPLRSDRVSRARAEALFAPREQQKAVPGGATAEYQAAQQAALARMHELRRLRLAREAELRRKP